MATIATSLLVAAVEGADTFEKRLSRASDWAMIGVLFGPLVGLFIALWIVEKYNLPFEADNPTGLKVGDDPVTIHGFGSGCFVVILGLVGGLVAAAWLFI